MLDGTDTHFYFGWFHGHVRDIERVAAAVPRVVRFVSEFGSDSPPLDAPFIDEQLARVRVAEPRLGPRRDDEGLSAGGHRAELRADGLRQLRRVARRVLQYYQAHVLKVQIETLRRLKYRPTGGFCFSSLNDSAATISSSILDHERRPKAAYAAVAAACATVLVTADPLPADAAPGDRVDLDVHVVSDRHDPIDFAVVDAVASWTWRASALALRRPGSRRRGREGGPHPPRGPECPRTPHARAATHRRRRHQPQPLHHRHRRPIAHCATAPGPHATDEPNAAIWSLRSSQAPNPTAPMSQTPLSASLCAAPATA